MTRIAPELLLRSSTGNVGGGPDAGDLDPVVDRHARRAEELGRTYDLVDRVQLDGAPARGAAPANQLEQARREPPASRAAKVRKDPTAVPPEAECRRSRAAIAAAGFTDVHLRPVPYFNQGSERWATHAYPRSPAVPGESRTIKDAGCAPTALAMIDCGLRDAHTPPTVTADFAVRHQVSGRPGVAGSDTGGLARRWAEQNGLALTEGTSSHPSRNVDVLRAGLEANGIALVSVGVDRRKGRGHFTRGGHVLVVNGCAMRDGQEWFAVANPGRADQSRPHHGLLATDESVNQIAGASNGIGQVWISRTQLEAEMKRCFVLRSGAES